MKITLKKLLQTLKKIGRTKYDEETSILTKATYQKNGTTRGPGGSPLANAIHLPQCLQAHQINICLKEQADGISCKTLKVSSCFLPSWIGSEGVAKRGLKWSSKKV